MPKMIGHARQHGFFENILVTGRLHHAYCFVGTEKIGKRTFAEQLAARLLNVTLDKLRSASDFFYLARGCDEKTGKLKKDISIEQVRGLINFINQTSFYKDGYKVALIDEAAGLSLSAANSLLKILEEPGDRTVFFLVTSDESRIIPTILSRIECWYFSRVPESELIEYATKFLRAQSVEGATFSADLTKDDVALMARAADGRPGLMVQWLENREAWRVHQARAEQFWSLFGASFHDKLERISGLYGDKKDHIAARDELTAALNIWLLETRQALREMYLNGSGNLATSVLLKIANILPETRRNLERNIHPRLLMERLLLEIP